MTHAPATPDSFTGRTIANRLVLSRDPERTGRSPFYHVVCNGCGTRKSVHVETLRQNHGCRACSYWKIAKNEPPAHPARQRPPRVRMPQVRQPELSGAHPVRASSQPLAAGSPISWGAIRLPCQIEAGF